MWQTTFWRFESNGWPRSRLHAINLPYPLARTEDAKAEPGRSSTAEHRDYLKGEIDKVLRQTGARLEVYAVQSSGADAGSRIGQAVHAKTIDNDGKWGPFNAQPGVPLEFVISAPGYATTHIYRSGFPRSSNIIMLRPERIAEADRSAKQIVVMTRPRGYMDGARDRMMLDGRAPSGLPPRGGMLSISKLLLQEDAPRAVQADFNGERLVGRSWNAADGHVTLLEITQ